LKPCYLATAWLLVYHALNVKLSVGLCFYSDSVYQSFYVIQCGVNCAIRINFHGTFHSQSCNNRCILVVENSKDCIGPSKG